MDSISLDLFITPKTVSTKKLETLPVANAVQRTGSAEVREYLTSSNGYSPITGAGFSVRPIRHEHSEHVLDICGYRIEANIPACSAGNNLVLSNDMQASCQIALQLLKHWLVSNGAHPDTLDAFSLSNASIHSVTPTFLVEFPDNHSANAAKRKLFDHAEAIHNYKLRTKESLEDRVTWFGSSRRGTWYIDHHDYKVRVYVKNGRTKYCFVDFKSAGVSKELIKQKMYQYAGRFLRIETDLSRNWLKRNGLSTPNDWAVENNNGYEFAFNIVEGELLADFKFRKRKFKAKDLPKAGTKLRILIDYYLSGGNVREHKLIAISYDQVKAFSEINQAARKKGIEFTIPWSIHQSMIAHNLKDLLAVQMNYKPPKNVADYVFGPHSSKAMIAALSDELKKAIDNRKKVRQVSKPNSMPGSGSVKVTPYLNNIDDDEAQETSDISDLMD